MQCIFIPLKLKDIMILDTSKASQLECIKIIIISYNQLKINTDRMKYNQLLKNDKYFSYSLFYLENIF